MVVRPRSPAAGPAQERTGDPATGGLRAGPGTVQAARLSFSRIPSTLPSMSRKCACQPTPGIACFGTRTLPPRGDDFFRGFVNRNHLGCDKDTGVRPVLFPGDAPVNAGFCLFAGRDQPVVDRALPFFALPAQHGTVEPSDPLRVFCRDLEMDDTGHDESREVSSTG